MFQLFGNILCTVWAWERDVAKWGCWLLLPILKDLSSSKVGKLCVIRCSWFFCTCCSYFMLTTCKAPMKMFFFKNSIIIGKPAMAIPSADEYWELNLLALLSWGFIKPRQNRLSWQWHDTHGDIYQMQVADYLVIFGCHFPRQPSTPVVIWIERDQKFKTMIKDIFMAQDYGTRLLLRRG